MTPRTQPTSKLALTLAVLQGHESVNSVLDRLDRREFESEYESAYAKLLNGVTVATYNGIDYHEIMPREKWTRRVR